MYNESVYIVCSCLVSYEHYITCFIHKPVEKSTLPVHLPLERNQCICMADISLIWLIGYISTTAKM